MIEHIPSLVMLVLMMLCLMWMGSRGIEKLPTIRRLPALDQLDEAIGRATELGRPILFSCGQPIYGLFDPDIPGIISGISVLEDIARKVAKLDIKLITVVTKGQLAPLIHDAVRTGYTEGGKPELYSPEEIRYYSDNFFAQTTSTIADMYRENVAVNIFMGIFHSPSLILAEAGSRLGALQIGGNVVYSNVPFFVATCNYFLIGEEVTAAGAYISKSPQAIASIATTDIFRIGVIVAIIVGLIISAVTGINVGEFLIG